MLFSLEDEDERIERQINFLLKSQEGGEKKFIDFDKLTES